MDYIHKAILDSMSEAVYVIDREMKIVYSNPASEELTGYTNTEAVGAMCSEIFCETSERCALGCPPKIAMDTATPVLHREAVTKTKQGEERRTQISISPIIEDGQCMGDVIVIKDITELRRAEEEIRRQNRFLTTVIDALPHPFCVIDAENYEIRMANKAASAGEISPGLKCHELSHMRAMPCTDKNHPCPYNEVKQYKTPIVVEHAHSDPDGNLRSVEVHCVPVLDDKGSVVQMIEYVLDISERKTFEDKLKQLAYFDHLTGLPNRTLFFDRLMQAISLARRNTHKLALLYMDLDKFKVINDTLGHDAGDALLRETARRISGCLRASDTMARMGGDEFAITLPEVKVPDDVYTVAQKITDVMKIPFILGGREVGVGMSVGVSLFPDDGDTPDDLMKKADVAMYRAKACHENVCEFYAKR